MREVEKKGIGKAGLVIFAVLIVVLIVSNVWSYIVLKNQINALETQVNTLQSQINSLNTTYQDYMASHHHTDSEYDAMKR
jgi:outer membrane murein-binding lipoprotein Lpp